MTCVDGQIFIKINFYLHAINGTPLKQSLHIYENSETIE
jgi:hypothetical protein